MTMDAHGSDLSWFRREGYVRPYTFRSVSLDTLVVSLFVWSAIALVVSLQLLDFALGFRSPPQQWSGYGYFEFGMVLAGVVVVHEAIHAVVARAFGLRVSFGVKWYAVYTVPYGGCVTRWQNGLISLAPLVVITVGCLITYVFAASTELVTIAIFVLISNGIGSGFDLRSSFRLFRYPRGTIFEKPGREEQTAIYEPEEHAVIADSIREETESELPRDPRDVLFAEVGHWMTDCWIAATNGHLRLTGRLYARLLRKRVGDWFTTQTHPSVHSTPRSNHD